MKSLRLLSKISLLFKEVEYFDQQILQALESIGRSMNVSRTYVYLDNSVGDVALKAYE